jgi:diguanylate cyclase (GGDEF)-like protein/PAS domain S-box-containing protein
MKFTQNESAALYGLLADGTTDVVIRTDRDGSIAHVSRAITQWDLALPTDVVGHNIADLVHHAHADAVAHRHDDIIAGRQESVTVEFPARTHGDRERWFELRMRGLIDDDGRIYGAISIMRSIDERRTYEQQLFVAAMTDPLTGLTNRRAFIAMLQHLVDSEVGGCLAMFSIDHFRAINIRHGHVVGDEVVVVVSDLVRNSMREQDIISRIGGESLGVLLPRATPDQAEAICQRIIATLSEIGRAPGPESFSITASAGVSRIAGSLDNTMRRAELALAVAKAKGRNRLEMAEDRRMPGVLTG